MGKSTMSRLEFVSESLRNYVAPVGSAPSVQERIRNASIKLRWKFTRTKDLWYGDERYAVRPDELEKIEEYTGVRYGRQEVHELDRYIARADAILARTVSDLDRAAIDALREAFGFEDSPGA